MKNFFEFFGFLTTACMSAILVFSYIGKKEHRSGGTEPTERLVSKHSTAAIEYDEPSAARDEPSRITGKGARRSEGEYGFTPAGAYGNKKAKKEAVIIEDDSENIAPEEKLKSLYKDRDFVLSSAKKWKNIVSDISEEYNVRPQVLLAHALVQSYVGPYSKAQLERDAAQHGGEQVMSEANALKRYRYGWTMQRLLNGFDLSGYFPEDVPVATASIARPSMKPTKTPATTKSGKTTVPAVSKLSPVEEGIRTMVAKEHGFSNWQGLMRLADQDTKVDAQKRVKSLMTAARIR